MSWESQESREKELLTLERAGGLSMGTGLGGGLQITHTIGTDGEGQYASFVVLSLRNNKDESVSIPISPDWYGTMDQLIGSLRYHAAEAIRITKERQAQAEAARQS